MKRENTDLKNQSIKNNGITSNKYKTIAKFELIFLDFHFLFLPFQKMTDDLSLGN